MSPQQAETFGGSVQQRVITGHTLLSPGKGTVNHLTSITGRNLGLLPPKSHLSLLSSLFDFPQNLMVSSPPSVVPPVGARLFPYVTIKAWVLTIVLVRYAIELESKPPTLHFVITPPSTCLRQELDDLLAKGGD